MQCLGRKASQISMSEWAARLGIPNVLTHSSLKGKCLHEDQDELLRIPVSARWELATSAAALGIC